MKKLHLLATYILFINILAFGQVVTTEPYLPTAEEPVTIYFNAVGTGLEGCTGDVYAHTGLTIDDNLWQHVIGDWNNNSNQPQLENIGTDLYKLEIDPSIRDFYGAGASENITQMSFVFRNADGSSQTSPDIFIEIFDYELNVSLIKPALNPYFVEPGEEIEIFAATILSDSIFLYIDDVLIASTSNPELEETHLAEMDDDTKHWIKIVAKSGTDQVSDSAYYYIRGESLIADLPTGVKEGINYIDENTVTLVLFAPLKTSIFVVGDFNNWEIGPDYRLARTTEDANDPETRYWLTLESLNAGEEYAYQYFIDEEILLGDPYCEKILDPWNDQYISDQTYPDLKPYPFGKGEGIVSVFQTNQEEYQWQNESFEPPAVTDLVVYELLIRDFTAQHTYQSLIDTLDYLKRLGVNAIELMPVNEFEGNLSWGYNPNYYFAVDKYYGTKNSFKEFVDVCHNEGIAVILDVVYNHSFGTSPYVLLYWDANNNRPAENSPFYNPIPKHDFNVGYDMNHQNGATKKYISRAVKFWIDEFKIDGYRFDLSKGFTQTNTLGNTGQWGQYDQSRIDILKEYADTIWSVNEDAYIILEHFADNSEEVVLSNYGMMSWGNSNYNYNEATMGWIPNSDFSWISYKKRGWNDPHVMGYMESHDEERLMAKNINYGNSNGTYDIRDTSIALTRIELAGVFFFTIPGPKMIWQFGELGYDFHINYPGVIGDDDHRTDEKPIRWDYASDWRRDRVFQMFSSLIELKKEHDAFRTSDFTLSLSGAMKKIHLNHSLMNVTILGNFDVVSAAITPNFQNAGYWYEFFSGDSVLVANTSEPVFLQPGEYRLYSDIKLESGPDLGIFNTDNDKKFPMIVYPNPSSDDINIVFSLSELSEVKMSIFDINGQKIKTIIDKKLIPGEHKIKWNALNKSGRKASKGMYFFELTINNKKVVQKVVLK